MLKHLRMSSTWIIPKVNIIFILSIYILQNNNYIRNEQK